MSAGWPWPGTGTPSSRPTSSWLRAGSLPSSHLAHEPRRAERCHPLTSPWSRPSPPGSPLGLIQSPHTGSAHRPGHELHKCSRAPPGSGHKPHIAQELKSICSLNWSSLTHLFKPTFMCRPLGDLEAPPCGKTCSRPGEGRPPLQRHPGGQCVEGGACQVAKWGSQHRLKTEDRRRPEASSGVWAPWAGVSRGGLSARGFVQGNLGRSWERKVAQKPQG